jgi:hypothetical protein
MNHATTEREDRAISSHAVGGEEIPNAGEFGGRLGGLAVRSRREHGHEAGELRGETGLGRRDARRGDRDALLAGGHSTFSHGQGFLAHPGPDTDGVGALA